MKTHWLSDHDHIQLDSVELVNQLNSQHGWSAQFRQLKPAQFKGIVDMRTFRNVTIAKEHYNTRLNVSSSPPNGKVALLMGLADQPGLRVNGQELSENSILLIWPGADTWTFIPESCAYYVAHFEASDFLTCLEHLYPSIKSMITTSGIGLYHCLPDYVESLRNLLVDGLYGQMGCAAAIKELYSDLRFNVLDMLAATYSTQNTNRGAADSRRKVALKTCKYIEANFQRTITLEELTRGVNCSHRTLQRIFRETFDLTIRDYLKACRLNAAHSALISSNREITSVTEVALDSGYSHLGRFSLDYKFLMKESPSASLRKASGRG